MLRDFGQVTVVDLSVSLLGVLAVLPAVLVLVERRRPAPGAGSGRTSGRPRVRSGWLVGLLGVLALAYITANTLRTEGVGSRGPVAGEPLPQFAAPLASSDLEGDANVGPGEGACRVRGPQVMNVCDLAARGPLVLAFVGPGWGSASARSTSSSGSPRASPTSSSPRSRCAATARGAECASGAADPGRPRPRRRGGEPLRRRRLPVRDLRPTRRRGGGLRADVPRRGRAGGAAGAGGAAVSDPELVAGPVDPAVAAELPGLAVVAARVPFAAGRAAGDPRAAALRGRPAGAARRPSCCARRAGAVGVPRALPPPRDRPGRDAGRPSRRSCSSGCCTAGCARRGCPRTRWRSRCSRRAWRCTRSTPRRCGARSGSRRGEAARAGRRRRADRAALLAARGRITRPAAARARCSSSRVVAPEVARAVRREAGVDGGRRAPYG